MAAKIAKVTRIFPASNRSALHCVKWQEGALVFKRCLLDTKCRRVICICYHCILYYTKIVFALLRFPDTVLASGRARHPENVFQDFRGRPPSSHALFKSYGFA